MGLWQLSVMWNEQDVSQPLPRSSRYQRQISARCGRSTWSKPHFKSVWNSPDSPLSTGWCVQESALDVSYLSTDIVLLMSYLNSKRLVWIHLHFHDHAMVMVYFLYTTCPGDIPRGMPDIIGWDHVCHGSDEGKPRYRKYMGGGWNFLSGHWGTSQDTSNHIGHGSYMSLGQIPVGGQAGLWSGQRSGRGIHWLAAPCYTWFASPPPTLHPHTLCEAWAWTKLSL